MEFEAFHIKRLFELLAEKKKIDPCHSGFKSIDGDHDLDLVSGKYLYEKYGEALRAIEMKEKHIKCRLSILNTIAKATNFDSYTSFLQQFTFIQSSAHARFVGNWWSYARANAIPALLKAPVKISSDAHGILQMKMKGGQNNFKGIVEIRANNLFCQLDAGNEKMFQIILKTGALERIQVMQGVFSGISSGFEPIAGREVFIKEEELDFENMIWRSFPLNAKTHELHKHVLNYFKTYKGNCIRGGRSSTFSIEDLLLK